MELFWLAYALIIVIGAAIGAWRRRHVTPYEDPHRTVTAMRDKQRLLYYFGTSGEIESPDGLRRRERR
jgi:hypothetical protein